MCTILGKRNARRGGSRYTDLPPFREEIFFSANGNKRSLVCVWSKNSSKNNPEEECNPQSNRLEKFPLDQPNEVNRSINNKDKEKRSWFKKAKTWWCWRWWLLFGENKQRGRWRRTSRVAFSSSVSVQCLVGNNRIVRWSNFWTHLPPKSHRSTIFFGNGLCEMLPYLRIAN